MPVWMFPIAAATLALMACPESGPAPVTPADATSTDATSDAASDVASDVAPDAAPDVAPDLPAPPCDPPTGLRPSRRSEHAGIYDPAGHRIIIYGGSFAVPINCGFPTPTFESEVWSYDIACDAWSQIGDTGPGGRGRHMAAYDSARHQMVVFGGRYRSLASGSYTLYNDLWALDLSTETWKSVPLATSTTPSPRINGAFVYDPTGDRLLLFGGNASTSGAFYQSLSDVWEYSFGTEQWTQLSPSGAQSPSSRLFMGALWDDTRQWLVVYGGADETAFNQNVQYFDDLWALDFSAGAPAWSELDGASQFAPKGRFWAGLVHDTLNDRYVLSGGHDNGAIAPDVGNRNDMWTFDPQTFEWYMHREGDVWNAGALGFCSFPVDFTIVDTELPERRNSHVFVSDGDTGYITGGKTDCGVVDDLWALDFASMTWEEETFATVGEVCWRNSGSPDFCTDMCL